MELESSQVSTTPLGRLRVSQPRTGLTSASGARQRANIRRSIWTWISPIAWSMSSRRDSMRCCVPANPQLHARRSGGCAPSTYTWWRHPLSDLTAHTADVSRPAAAHLRALPLSQQRHAGNLDAAALARRSRSGSTCLEICNSVESCLCLASRGLAITHLPDFTVADALADERSCTVLAEHLRSTSRQRAGAFSGQRVTNLQNSVPAGPSLWRMP